jgi:hypothetical protein
MYVRSTLCSAPNYTQAGRNEALEEGNIYKTGFILLNREEFIRQVLYDLIEKNL